METEYTSRRPLLMALLAMLIMVSPAAMAQDLYWGGFVEGLWTGGLNDNNPTGRDYPASEVRLQLRAESYSSVAEAFSKIDFVQDGFDSTTYEIELREAYIRFRIPIGLDFKVGRQILTWGTGDLIFINDVFAKDYQSFFIGRQDQYLKAPQTGIRSELYTGIGAFSFVFIPDFEPNILPTGNRLSFYDPMEMTIVGQATPGYIYMTPVEPGNSFDNAELAVRYKNRIGGFELAGYAYRGFYKDPRGFDQSIGAYYPRLNVYGASLRGQIIGGILWIEGGYYDSREDTDGDNYFIENSSLKGLIGFERQVATDFTGNIQFQIEQMQSYDDYAAARSALIDAAMLPPTAPKAEEIRTLLTSRWTKQLMMQTMTISAFGFYSPSDQDAYVRFSIEYKYSDELSLMAGGNIFDGEDIHTQFGQFDLNDNLYVKINYGF